MLIRKYLIILLLTVYASTAAHTSAQQQTGSPQTPKPTRADILRGEHGPFRANNDLLFYHLDVRVDPEKKFLSGKTTIRFRMLKDDTRIQMDLHAALTVDRILLVPQPPLFRNRRAALNGGPVDSGLTRSLKYT